jgi:hypothetical protein
VDPDVALDLSTAALIVEGIRRLPESDVFRERLGEGKSIPVLSPGPDVPFPVPAADAQEVPAVAGRTA